MSSFWAAIVAFFKAILDSLLGHREELQEDVDSRADNREIGRLEQRNAQMEADAAARDERARIDEEVRRMSDEEINARLGGRK